MNKYINTDELNKAVEKCQDEPFTKDTVYAITELLPSADVVMCKDCKKQNECGLYVDSEPEWFCADGERRTEE